MAKDLYATLGVSRGAEQSEIKRAYKDLARKYHPDRNPSPQGAERFKDITAAYDVLGDAEKRKLYDEFGEVSLKPGFNADEARRFSQGFGGFGGGGGGFGGGGPNINDILNGMFGGGQPGGGFGGGQPGGGFGGGFGGGPQPGFGGGFDRGGRGMRGRDLEGDVHVNLAQVIKGDPVEVTVRRPVYHGDGSVSMKSASLKVRVPENVKDGGVVRLRGKGAPGRGGAPAGDLLLKVHLTAHPYLRKEGDELVMDVPVTVKEAILGGRIEVPTPGGVVRVKVPAGCTSGTKLRLRGKGAQGPRGRGDLLLILRPQVPKTHDPKAVELAEQLDAFYEGDVRAALDL